MLTIGENWLALLRHDENLIIFLSQFLVTIHFFLHMQRQFQTSQTETVQKMQIGMFSLYEGELLKKPAMEFLKNDNFRC